MKFFYIIFIIISVQLNAQWTSLIGDDLSNWETVQGKAIFELNDGIISSSSVLNSPNTFLITKDTYSDFILEFEVFVEEGLKITLRRSKTDQYGEGLIKGLPYFTNENYCPTLKGVVNSELDENVNSVLEIVMDAVDEDTLKLAMKTGIKAAANSPGVVKITAGNFDGKLGKYQIHLKDLL